jgi:glycogen operon protein
MKESKRLKQLRKSISKKPSWLDISSKKGQPNTVPKSQEHPLTDDVTKESDRPDVRIGVPLPMGANAHGDGVNFAFFSRHASHARLELFNHPEEITAARVIDLDSVRHRTGDIWHVWVKGVCSGQFYAYRVDGPYTPGEGHRFNFNKLLLDPFATAISQQPPWDFVAARGYDLSASAYDSTPSTLDDSASIPKSFDIRGRRRLFTRHTCGALALIPVRA